jgi:hypothetical protein
MTRRRVSPRKYEVMNPRGLDPSVDPSLPVGEDGKVRIAQAGYNGVYYQWFFGDIVEMPKDMPEDHIQGMIDSGFIREVTDA